MTEGTTARFDGPLGSILNMSIATSDLEDMFRTDPMMENSRTDDSFEFHQQWGPTAMAEPTFYSDLGPGWDRNASFTDQFFPANPNNQFYMPIAEARQDQNMFSGGLGS